MENWRIIVEFPEYEVSDCGNVRRISSGKVLKPGKSGARRCYNFVMLGLGNNRTIHRLVALTFIPNPENKPCVDHKDGNTFNNAVENLRWVTRSENSKNMKVTNSTGFKGVQAHGKKFRAKIEINGKSTHLGTFETAEAAHEAYKAAASEHFGDYARFQ
jgi:hypothetical protein